MIQKQIQERQKKEKKNKTQESLKEERLFCFFSSCLQMGNTCLGNIRYS